MSPRRIVELKAQPSGEWVLTDEQSSRSFDDRAEAERAAQDGLRRDGGELRIRGRTGRTTSAFVLGHTAIQKINAVEGLATPLYRASDKP